MFKYLFIFIFLFLYSNAQASNKDKIIEYLQNTKNINFNHLIASNEKTREISSTYLHVPLLLKFSTDRYKNIRPYVLGGLSYNYNFSSNEENQVNKSSGQFRM